MTPIPDSLAAHCRPLCVVLLVCAVGLACFLPRMEIDNSVEVWLKPNSKAYQQYQKFLDLFGSEEFVIVAGQVDDPFSDAALSIQRRLGQQLRGLEGVCRVLDVPTIGEAFWQNAPDWQWTAKRLGVLDNLLIGRDGKTVGILVQLSKLEGARARRKVVQAIESVVSKATNKDFQPHLVGTPVMNVALDRGSERDAKTFMPIAIAVSIAVLVASLRNLGGVLAAMVSVATTVISTVGLMAIAGKTMNMVTVALPSLLSVLAVSNAIHIVSRFGLHRASGMDTDSALRQTLRDLVRPATLSSVTTAVGFCSLMLSNMRAVSDLGMFAGMGMLISLACNLAVLPGVLRFLPSRLTRARRSHTPHWSGRSGRAMSLRWRLASAVAAAGFALCFAAVGRINVESNVLKFLSPASKTAQDYAFVAEHLTGLYTLELVVLADEADEELAMQEIAALAGEIESRDDVARVNTASRFQPQTALAGGARLASVQEPPLLAELRGGFRREADDKVALRMSMLATPMASNDSARLVEAIREEARDLPERLKWYVTGVVLLLNEAQDSLVQTQIQSFGLAAGVVLVMIALLFRSWRAAVASVLPNLLPVGITFGIMALAGIDLNAATVMIASVAIGIAADDTIHFLARYQQELGDATAPPEAAERTLSAIGREMGFTSVVAAAGFSVLCFGQFRPLIHFGLLTGVAMIVALGADWFVLPATARLVRLWEKR